MGSPVCASSTTKGAQQSDPADYQRAGGGGEVLLKTCLCLSAIPRKGFSSARYFCPVSVLSNIRASRRSPCTSLEDEKGFLTLPGSASNVNTRALSSCSREPPL